MVDREATSIHGEFGGDRLSTGQRRTVRFPVLSKSATPAWDLAAWEFSVDGAVDDELSSAWAEFGDLPRETQCQDFRCVTGWSRFDNEFAGVTFLAEPKRGYWERRGVSDAANPRAEERYSSLRGTGGRPIETDVVPRPTATPGPVAIE